MPTHDSSTARDRINIAIDGPAGAGKSTVARQVAKRLGYVYIDTGAMYRAVTLAALRSGTAIDENDKMSQLVAELDIRLEPGDPVQRVCLNGEDVTEAIRGREVTQSVSAVAAIEAVRLRLVDKQRELARARGVVMDGRDIGSHVLPNAELKVFLTASVEERALRRFKESGEAQGIALADLEREIAERDRKDAGRAISPLIQAADAVLIDSTELTIEEVSSRITELGLTKMAEGTTR